MRINHTISAMIAKTSLFKGAREMFKSLERLSTGLHINQAFDDAAGHACIATIVIRVTERAISP